MRSTQKISEEQGRLSLSPFNPLHAAEIARWVDTEEQLRWLAPGTAWPLTAAKVVAWKKPGGEAFIFTRDGDTKPLGYGELSPMRGRTDHMWLGHVVIRPDQRGTGAGQTFVRALLDRAFNQHVANRVSLIVFPDNAAAIRCYRRAGFAVAGEEHYRFTDSGPKHLLLRLQIDAPLL